MVTMKQVFSKIAQQEHKLETVADGILNVARDAAAGTVEEFDALVFEAYDAHGWNYQPGRPAPGVEVKQVPDAVRTYVSEVRGAYRAGLDVLGFQTMYSLRKALREARQPSTKPGATARRLWKQFPELQGVRIEADDEFNGALFHDLLVAYEKAPDDVREKMQRRARRMLTEFKPAVEDRAAA